MNEHDLETLLQSLAPARPSPGLAERVDRELALDMSWAQTPLRRAPRWWSPVMWSSVGAAAAVALMSLLPSGETPVLVAQPSAGTAVMPVTTLREVVEAQDEGIRYNELSNLPEQHLKLVSLERHAWIDPRDGAHITVEMPREDSVVLPVAFQ
jgi:anti-sigma-K factor RskA